MFAFAKAVTALLISPLGLALVLGVVAALMLLFRRPGRAMLAGTLAFIWLGLWSTPWASNKLGASLEAAYPPQQMSAVPQAQAIVVLGGGIAPPAPGQNVPNLNAAADRMWHAARLYRAGKAPLVVLSGGRGAMNESTSEAAAMKLLMLEWGLPESAMLLEEASRNTTENALMTQQLLLPRGIRRVLLVTSALHMQRAVAAFEAQGLQVLPAPTDHETGDISHWPWWQLYLPSTGALDGSARAMKEWVGRRVL